MSPIQNHIGMCANLAVQGWTAVFGSRGSRGIVNDICCRVGALVVIKEESLVLCGQSSRITGMLSSNDLPTIGNELHR